MGGGRLRAHLRLRLRRGGGGAAVLTGLVVSGLLVLQSTDAAFTAPTGSVVSFTTGSVVITDDDAGQALFSMADLLPGATAVRCVTVTYTGTLTSQVRLHATTSGTGLAAYLALKITRGSFGTPPGGGDCTGFTADTADYAALGAGVLHDSTLSALGSTWAAGTVDPSTTAFPAAEAWTVNETHAYRIQVTLIDDDAAQGRTAMPTFTWEARDSAAAGAGSRYHQEVLADAPVAYWRLGESAGTTATDAKGARNGTYTNGPARGAAGALVDDPDTATTFDGVDDRVDVPYAAALNPTTFTVEAWARATDTSAGFKTVVSSWANPAAAGFGIWADGANWAFYLGRGAGSTPVYAPITTGAWTHLAATYQGTTMRLYVDGQLAASGTASYLANTTSPLGIGGATYGGGVWQHFLNGGVDEVAVYSTALSQPRIQAHYAAGR